MCECISPVREDFTGSVPPVMMECDYWNCRPDLDGTIKRFSVDACMAPRIQKLWDKGIKTYSSCCGHNGQWAFTEENKGKKLAAMHLEPAIIVRKEDAQEAHKLLGEDCHILCWRDKVLVEQLN